MIAGRLVPATSRRILRSAPRTAIQRAAPLAEEASGANAELCIVASVGEHPHEVFVHWEPAVQRRS